MSPDARADGFRDIRKREREVRVTASPDEPQGTELLAEEIRDEAGQLVHHPVAEMKRLRGVAGEGESAATPLILFIGVALALAVIATVVMTVVFLAYYEG
jgi:hypothetical protein